MKLITFLSEEHACKFAEYFIKLLIDLRYPWPEDEWVEISENWDLNLWEMDGKIQATLYPVSNSLTNTQAREAVSLNLSAYQSSAFGLER
jgi:hypothetical protein